MLVEAELESQKTQKTIFAINKKIAEDDELMVLLEDERRDLLREQKLVEKDYAYWSGAFASRLDEKRDIQVGLEQLKQAREVNIDEKAKIRTELTELRQILPPCIALLRSLFEAASIAAVLNTTVQGVSAEQFTTDKKAAPPLRTPADIVRTRMKKDGFKSLTVEEQQWTVMDQQLNPQRYEWLREQQEEERNRRISAGKKIKPIKLPAPVAPFEIAKVELLHIMKQPHSMLTRREQIIRKLLSKYHDNVDLMKRKSQGSSFGFDPSRAEKVRSTDFSAYSKEEKEWKSVDSVLHPEVWSYYVNHDHHANAALSGGSAKAVRPSDEARGTLNMASDLGRILGLSQDVIDSQVAGAGGDLSVLAKQTQGRMNAQAASAKLWTCPFTADQILKIWRSPRQSLTTEDELKTYALLQKFNGTYAAYIEAKADSAIRDGNAVHTGSHIRWGAGGGVADSDIDKRARDVLRELDRAMTTRNEWMDTSVLQSGTDQRFPTKVMQGYLQAELERILRAQVVLTQY